MLWLCSFTPKTAVAPLLTLTDLALASLNFSTNQRKPTGRLVSGSEN